MTSMPGSQPPPVPPARDAGGQPPPPPRPRGGGVLRTVFRIVGGLALLGSLGLNLILLAFWAAGGSSGGENAPPVLTTVKKGTASQTVAVIAINGAIDDRAATRFNRLVDAVEEDADAKVLVVEIDSPGGTVTASDEIHGRILRYKAARAAAGKTATVVVTMRSMATSGGYYVACAGDWVFAEQTTWTGNIGVLMPQYNVSALMEKYGVKESTVVSSGADFKNVGSPFQPETEKGRAYLQALADAAFTRFKAVVTQGRGSKLTAKPEDVFNGKIFQGPEALASGLVDQIGFPEDAYAYAASAAKLSNPRVLRYGEPAKGLFATLFGGGADAHSSAPGPDASATSTAPPSLRDLARPETLDAWRSPRVLYR
ncbi:MAG TPA: signal peptide peptidase SppA [Humisphaera sp.]